MSTGIGTYSTGTGTDNLAVITWLLALIAQVLSALLSTSTGTDSTGISTGIVTNGTSADTRWHSFLTAGKQTFVIGVQCIEQTNALFSTETPPVHI